MVSFSPTSVFQVEPTQKSVELGIVKLDACLTFGRNGQLENANLEPLVPNSKTIHIPEQNLDPVPLPIKEQEQVAGQWVLIKNLLSQSHQDIEAELHPDRIQADKDADIGKVDVGHALPNLGRKAPTASRILTSAASPTPTGTFTEPPLGNSISTKDVVSVTGKNFGSANSAKVGAFPSSFTDSGIPS
jgi:hypothetical protein